MTYSPYKPQKEKVWEGRLTMFFQIFARENEFVWRGLDQAYGWEKPIWRQFQGLEEVFPLIYTFPSRTFSRMGSKHRLHKEKIAIFKLFWKYLIVKTFLLLWTICVVWTSLYLMVLGASWLLGRLFLKSTIICHGVRYILKKTRGNG